MSDRDMQRGNCDAPEHFEVKGESHYYDEEFCVNFRPLPTPPVDAPPAEPIEYTGPRGKPVKINTPAAPPQDVSEGELRSLFQDVIDEGCHCDVQVGFSCGIHSKVERLRFALTLAPERPAPAGAENIGEIHESQNASTMLPIPRSNRAGDSPAPAPNSPAQEDLELRERLAKSLWNLERNPGDAEWPKDATRQPYCKWAYAHADSLIAEFASLRRAAQAERQVAGADEIVEKCASVTPPVAHNFTGSANGFSKGYIQGYDEALALLRRAIRDLKGTFSLPAERVSAEELEKAMRAAIALFDGDPQLELREFKARAILQTALSATHTPESGGRE